MEYGESTCITDVHMRNQLFCDLSNRQVSGERKANRARETENQRMRLPGTGGSHTGTERRARAKSYGANLLHTVHAGLKARFDHLAGVGITPERTTTYFC